jgi:hypothetical protein
MPAAVRPPLLGAAELVPEAPLGAGLFELGGVATAVDGTLVLVSRRSALV